MEEDAPRLMECDGDLSKTDGSGLNHQRMMTQALTLEESWESRDVLCG